MGTKAQLIEFILERFEESDGDAPSKNKLDQCKKADLEELVKAHNLESEFESWLASK